MTIIKSNRTKKQDVSNNAVSKRDNCPFDCEQYNPVKSEMAMWTAVITQALMDAGSESAKPEAQHEKAKAIRWLLGNSEDFVTVCQNAGLDPQSIRKKAMLAIERGCVWRSGMAEKRRKTHSQPTRPSSLQKKFHLLPMQHHISKQIPAQFHLSSIKASQDYAISRC
jgi:hypothetical protein